MAQKGGEAHPRGGEPFYCHKRGLGFSQSFGEVRGCRDRWGKPVPEPSDLILGVENGPIQVDRCTRKKEIGGFFFFIFFYFFLFFIMYSLIKVQETVWSASYDRNKTYKQSNDPLHPLMGKIKPL